MRHAVTLDALRVLEAINAKGSFAAAADALFKVPSALTYTISKLETDLGVALFDRKGQRATLTPAGKLVLAEGVELLQAANSLEERVQQLESGWEAKLIIAKDTVIPDEPLLALIAQICQLDKHVEITVIEEALGGGWDALQSKRADIALGVTGELPKGQYHVSQLGELEFVFVVSASHPLANFIGLIEGHHIRQFPYVVVADSSRNLPGRSSGLFDNKQLIRVSSMLSKAKAQVAGVGVGFLPLHIAKPYLDNGTLIAKATSLPRPPIPLYFAKEKSKTGKATQWFWQKISQQQWL